MSEAEINFTQKGKESSETLFNPRSIAIVTGTFYPTWYEDDAKGPLSADKLRGDLALQSFQSAQQQNFQLVVVDGGSSEAFKRALEQNSFYFELQKQKGFSSARRQGIERAQILQEVKVIVQTEPEKVSMVSNCIQPASLPILKNEADIVIPKRDEESFLTYPKLQAEQEQKVNKLYNAILRKHKLLKEDDPDLDDIYWAQRFFANKPEITELFMKTYQYHRGNTKLDEKVNVEMYSNIQFFPIVEALHRGLRVNSVLVPYLHPQIQTAFEEGNLEFDTKRHVQRRTIITELVNFIRYLENSPKTRLSKVV